MAPQASHPRIASVISEMARLDEEVSRLERQNQALSQEAEELRKRLADLAPVFANILATHIVERAGGDPIQLKRYYTETRDFLPLSLDNQESPWRERLETELDRAIDMLAFTNPRLRRWRQLAADVSPVVVSEPEEQKTKILFLSVSPADLPPLGVDDEIRSIKASLREAQYRDRFQVEQERAVRRSDLQALLLRHRPAIVHFSGHGTSAGEIILRDEDDVGRAVPQDALSELFAILRTSVRCVVLNACYSQDQAEAIARHVDVVVGMADAIGDQAATRFAEAFYRALAYGESLKTAFDLGCNAIQLESLPDHAVPRLLCPQGDPADMIFVS